MPSILPAFVGPWICAGLAALAAAGSVETAHAQDKPWRRLVAEADSIGPDTPLFAPSRWTPCTQAPAADSLRVTGPTEEFLFGTRSLRTRGMFSYFDLPATGSGTFALRAILCDDDTGKPLTFVLERDHRYFYLVFSLRDMPTYRALTLFTRTGPGSCFRWDPESSRFAPAACPGPGGAKC